MRWRGMAGVNDRRPVILVVIRRNRLSKRNKIMGLLTWLFGSRTDVAASPAMLCSHCMKLCEGEGANVIPSWNNDMDTFVTTYRCTACVTTSLNETRQRLTILDEKSRRSLCEFLRRYHIESDASKIEVLSLPEASVAALDVIARIESRDIILSPLR